MDYFLMDNPNMDINKTISDNLTDWMAGHPRFSTIKPLSVAAGIGFGTVRRIKNGDGNPTVESIEAIARVFHRSAIDLMKDQSAHFAPAPQVELYAVQEPPQDEKELLQGYRAASADDRETMMYLARKSIRNLDFSKRSETQ